VYLQTKADEAVNTASNPKSQLLGRHNPTNSGASSNNIWKSATQSQRNGTKKKVVILHLHAETTKNK